MNWHSLHGIVLLSILTLVSSQSCNTDQNPYCKGNSKFEQICCPYPNVCYWADRQGTPACCPYGQSCQAGGGGVITAPEPSTIYTSYTQPTSETQPSYSTITSYVTHPTTTAPGGGVIVITTTDPGVWEGATSTIAGAYSTVTSDVAGAFSTVTSDVAGAYTTVTSAVAGVATTIVQVFDGNDADQTQPSNIALAVALAAAIWHFV